jgi:hypothetical protein
MYITASKQREYDIAYGLHSGIPRCCIDFYINEWDNHRTLGTHYRSMLRDCTWGYVPCPRCFFQGIKVKIVDCLKDCKQKCWEVF